MYKVHGYLKDGNDIKLIINYRMPHIPRVGETARIDSDTYAIVADVVWCFDEDNSEGQRVNIQFDKIIQE